MFNLDSRLLQIFNEIYKQQSVSKAAKALDIGQPTLSVALGKLRDHFQDPLFIRIENKMVATVFAEEIYPYVHESLKNLKYLQSYSQHFEPLTTHQHFKISMTDISHLVLLPMLLKYLKEHAPYITLEILPITPEASTQLLNGDIDLLIGFIPQLEAGIYQQKLFNQHYVAICSPEHSRLTDHYSNAHIFEEFHIDIKATGGHFILEEELNKHDIHRNIIVTLPSYLGISELIKSTDNVAIIPYFLAKKIEQHGSIKILDLPVELPQYNIMQHWHHRNHNNLANQWLRRICYALFSDLK
jgi:DNA-binding transcriptional LysR family regulator